MKTAPEIRQAREERQRKRLAAARTKRTPTLPAGTATDEAWSGDRPPIEPSPGAPLKGDDARRLVRWCLNWAERSPRVPLSPSVTYWFKQVRRGESPLDHSRWSDVVEYVRKAKDRQKQKSVVQLQIRVGGGELGLSLLRPR